MLVKTRGMESREHKLTLARWMISFLLTRERRIMSNSSEINRRGEDGVHIKYSQFSQLNTKSSKEREGSGKLWKA